MVVPAAVVVGVGAVEDAVPPVAEVYQFSVPPVEGVAVKAEAEALWQYVTGLVTAGAAGVALTVTAREALGPSHVLTVCHT